MKTTKQIAVCLFLSGMCNTTPVFAALTAEEQAFEKQAAIARSHYNCAEELNTADEMQYCSGKALDQTTARMKKIYGKVRQHVHAKKELDEAQQAWIKYRDLQCGKFVALDSNISPAYMTTAQICAKALTDQRIDYLKYLLEQ